ncbi:MAG: aminotransferase class I/II-fold pyridoxal phosphate-dependent enzyme [Proteobacteria bacterium]|nr:aminotransferase class I/II-fold pyridoxal phosphate-dependent enzyme [Pseudomonadota bacterium]
MPQSILLSTPHIGDFEQQYVAEAFATNWIAPLGPNVDAFEREIAEYLNVPTAAALSSGTAAIHLALVLLNVGPNDRVFCSSFTFVASANPILYQGATPVFIDSEPTSWNMSPKALERALKEADAEGQLPKAVIVVNLYGQSADMDPLKALCDSYGVPIVEDAAESLGATYKNKASGTFGHIGIYSFNGNKIITTSGGGMLVAQDPEIVERARFLSTQSRDPAPHYQHSCVGYNYRMSNVLAGIGRGQLKVLDERVKARRDIYAAYTKEFSEYDSVNMMPEASYGRSTHWLSALILDPEKTDLKPKQLIDHLFQRNIEARHVWKPMHLQPIFSNAQYYSHELDFSVSDYLFNHAVCLPSGSNMTAQDITRVIAVSGEILTKELA